MSLVAITGAGGFLGTALTRAFRDAGHPVRAADLAGVDLATHQRLGAEPVVCDLSKPDTVRATVHGARVVVHAAGVFDLRAPETLLHRVNRDGVGVVVDAAAAAGVERLVLVSTCGVYGHCGLGTEESHAKHPRNAYERSKHEGELLGWRRCSELGLPLAVLRPTLIYGPGSRYGLAPAMALFALRARKGLGSLPIAEGGPVGHLVHVDDVAAAMRVDPKTVSLARRSAAQMFLEKQEELLDELVE